MNPSDKIYIAGHRGLVGTALMRNLRAKGCTNFITRTHAELDLTSEAAVEAFFAAEKPDYVLLAAYKNSVRQQLFLGSSCIYPKPAPQPMQEEHLLTSELKPANRTYAFFGRWLNPLHAIFVVSKSEQT
jgi:GDP-L-fucose synthase